MTTAENSVLYYEAGQTYVPMSELADSGDHKTFNSNTECWSDEAGFSPVIKPDGVLTGLVVTPAASESNDMVDVSAGTLNLAGVVTTLSAGADKTCLRGSGADICRINSITITSAGAVAVVSGAAHTAFSEVRGADGGPPYIPAGSVEIAQVRFSSITAAPVAGSQIMAVPNRHREMANYPSIVRINLIREQDTLIGVAGVDFSTALMRNHTGDGHQKSLCPVLRAGFHGSLECNRLSTGNNYHDNFFPAGLRRRHRGSQFRIEERQIQNLSGKRYFGPDLEKRGKEDLVQVFKLTGLNPRISSLRKVISGSPRIIRHEAASLRTAP